MEMSVTDTKNKGYAVYIDTETIADKTMYYWEIRKNGEYGKSIETSGIATSIEEALTNAKKAYEEIIAFNLIMEKEKADGKT